MSNENGDRFSYITEALGKLSPGGRTLVADLVRRLSEGEGFNCEAKAQPRLDRPADGIPHWVAKLRAERRSERTIQMYEYLARRHLIKDPTPTRLGLKHGPLLCVNLM